MTLHVDGRVDERPRVVSLHTASPGQLSDAMDIEAFGRPGRTPGRVLVVGAGPVGLVSALLARHHDVDVDVIDRNPEAVSQSRATDLHPATLERLDPYGITADLLDIGQVVRAAVVHCGGRVAGRIPMGCRGSPFPFALTVPQCTTEGLLQDHLSRLGCKVERGVELVSLEPHSNGAIATVTVGGDPSMLNQREYDWVLGCDGASSVVRCALQVRFGGATSSDVCAIADVELELPFPRDEIHLMLRHGGGVHVAADADRWLRASAGRPLAPARSASTRIRTRSATSRSHGSGSTDDERAVSVGLRRS